jgi:hypothetical protein
VGADNAGRAQIIDISAGRSQICIAPTHEERDVVPSAFRAECRSFVGGESTIISFLRVAAMKEPKGKSDGIDRISPDSAPISARGIAWIFGLFRWNQEHLM